MNYIFTYKHGDIYRQIIVKATDEKQALAALKKYRPEATDIQLVGTTEVEPKPYKGK